MLAMYSLLFNYFRKSFHTIFFGFVFPIIMLTLLVAVQGGNNASNTLPGLAMSSSSVIGIVTLSMTYCDFKQSIIIKRIGSTPLRSWEFIISILTFHVLLIFISCFWIMGIGVAIYHSQLDLKMVNWGYVILAILFASTICSAIGIIVGILATDFKMANAISLLLYLPTAFLSGQYIPYDAIKSQTALVVIAKILAFSYPVAIMNLGWNGFPNHQASALFNNYWLPSVVSLAWIVVLVSGAIFAYKYRRK